MSKPADVSVTRLFISPARRFVNSMGSTRRAVQLMQAQAWTSTQVESDFVTEAEFVYPDHPRDIHVAAARIVHDTVHAFTKARRALTAETDDAVDSIYKGTFGRLGEKLEDLTGDPGAEHRYRHVWTTINSRPSTQKLLGSALLMQAVSEFEVLVARLVRGMLAAHPDILRASDKTYSLRDMDPYTTIAELREVLAEDVADRVLRKGFTDWMTWFGSNLKTKVPGVLDGAAELTEVFQRRHLFVHNGGVVNESYLANVTGLSDPPDLGTSLHADRAYLNQAIDCLEASGFKLASAAALKYTSTEERTFVEEVLDRECYQSLVRGRSVVVADVTRWLIPRIEDSPSQLRMQVNSWLATKNLEGTDAIRKDVEAWDTRMLEDSFKLVQLALLDEAGPALDLVTTMLDRGELAEVSWRSWPVLDGVRKHALAIGADVPDTTGWNPSHAD